MTLFFCRYKIIFLVFFCVCWFYVSCDDFLSLLRSEIGDVCITNSSSSLYYTLPDGSIREETKLIPPSGYFCNFGEEKAACTDEFIKSSDWEKVNSLDYENIPIFDKRWEDLPVETISSTERKELLEFHDKKEFNITLSVRASEIQFSFCDGKDIKTASCYGFSIDENERSCVFRTSSSLLEKKDSDFTLCEQDEYLDRDHPLIEMKKWRHFTLEKMNENIYLKMIQNGVPKLILQHKDNSERIKIKYMLGTSKSTAYYKSHTYKYLRTASVSSRPIFPKMKSAKIKNKTICFSLFMTSCYSCSLEVFTFHRGKTEKILETKILPPSYGKWTEHKILFNITDGRYKYINIGFRTKGSERNRNNFWSIDSFRYCSFKEYRVSVAPVAGLKSCELLIPSKTLMWRPPTDVESPGCKSSELLGGLCIPCGQFIENNIVKTCEKLRFCEIINDVEKCFCQIGFTGDECKKECKQRTFGRGCGQKCNCSLNSECNKINGSCQCHKLFKGATCHLPIKGNILKEPPSVISSHPNSCIVQLVNRRSYGLSEFNYYLPQYKKKTQDVNSSKWIDFGNPKWLLPNETIEIKGLEMSSKYFIRILVSALSAEIKWLQNSYIPFTICNTTCSEWKEEDVNITEQNETIFVNVKTSQYKCNVTFYRWIIKTSDDNEILHGRARKSMNITDLHGGRVFRIHFLGPYGKNISKTFETLEKAPEPPADLQSYFTKNNTFGIYWKNPNNTNGILKKFEINFGIVDGKLNTAFVEAKNFSKNINKSYHFQFTKSIPCSEDIKVEVIALNSVRGEPAVIKNSSYPSRPYLLHPQIRLKNSTEATISGELNVTIQDHENKEKNQFYIYILVSDRNKDENLKMLEFLLDDEIDKGHFRIAEEFSLNDVNSSSLKFFIGRHTEQESKLLNETVIIDRPLKSNQFYNITILLVSGYKGKFRFTSYKSGDATQREPKGIKNDGLYALLLLLLLIPIVLGLIILRKKIYRAMATFSLRTITCYKVMSNHSESNILELEECTSGILNSETNLNIRAPAGNKDMEPPNPDEEILSKAVKVANLEAYIKETIESGELIRQHALFSETYTQPCTYGSLAENKSKNRYNNLIPYDHSRVKLDKLPEDEFSDYINANFIHGYRVPNAFIATQGPKKSTLADFWRMIWEQNVKHIIMLANVYESGKKKVEQYWPNPNEEFTIGHVCINFISVEIFADFEYKKFDIKKGSEVRKLEQLHFTSWPDHGVPLYPQSLVPFLRKMLKIRMSSSHPVVIHCSAGVGRTGTILLSDICLRMAAKEGAVDLLYNLQKLRQQRPRMVDNVEQYKLAHLVILETLMGLHTSIPCNRMERAMETLLSTEEYKMQMDYLIQTQWKDDAMKSVAEVDENFVVYNRKNRFPEFVPDNKSRILLTRYPENDLSSSYINAVKVDGFRNPGKFIVTQTPMPNTLSDFWRLVMEQQTRVIISLNEINLEDETCCQFLPTVENPEICPVNFLLLKLRKMQKMKDYDIYYVQMRVRNNEERNLDVIVLSFKLWKPEKELPCNHENFLSFWEEADTISRRSETVLVTCYDGRTASGIYVALSFVIEKIKLEQECDVCLAVRTIRHNRKQFVPSEVQFLFLYEVAVRYMKSFQSYANFQDQ